MPKEQGHFARKLSKSFYIDNCATSVDNETKLVDFVKCSTKILADAKMDLRMQTSGPVGEEVRSTLESLNAESTLDNIVPVLGIMWDKKDDTLYAESKTVLVTENLSKKGVPDAGNV
ncbi:integrase catalytic domain-containing protein [Trichonephila clavata]|uniref:Integrase catalytic domain-containing protein n=1 Tax=Trichonephila clavata TaxID=2740835 RepID=A0A8X6GDY2_TRICU|nr:integrase catalytic domain-containing protein [Trichonephila clavata]